MKIKKIVERIIKKIYFIFFFSKFLSVNEFKKYKKINIIGGAKPNIFTSIKIAEVIENKIAFIIFSFNKKL